MSQSYRTGHPSNFIYTVIKRTLSLRVILVYSILFMKFYLEHFKPRDYLHEHHYCTNTMSPVTAPDHHTWVIRDVWLLLLDADFFRTMGSMTIGYVHSRGLCHFSQFFAYCFSHSLSFRFSPCHSGLAYEFSTKWGC